MISAPASSMIKVPFPGSSGRGLKIAVIDSGINARHPHIFAKTSGILVDNLQQNSPANSSDSWNDELGHGTAVAAAIQEKAPGAEYYAVKLFGKSLSATSGRLLQGMAWAIDQGVDLINLSLGTHNLDYRSDFQTMAKRAAATGTIIICARYEGDRSILPGMLDDVLSVDVDWQLSRDQYRILHDGANCYAASGFPRSLPGVSPVRNLSGVSFAVANMTGLVARACEQLQQRSLLAIQEVLVQEASRIQA